MAAAAATETEIPLRAKYCRVSQRYVATYDHFCGMLGTCIGERNRCRFWLFLFSHSMLVWWAIGLVRGRAQRGGRASPPHLIRPPPPCPGVLGDPLPPDLV